MTELRSVSYAIPVLKVLGGLGLSQVWELPPIEQQPIQKHLLANSGMQVFFVELLQKNFLKNQFETAPGVLPYPT